MSENPVKSAAPILGAVHLFKDYRLGRQVLRVLMDISLDVKKGELLAIVGPSGAGKSTLLHLLGLLDTPTQGKVKIEGEDINLFSDRKRAVKRNELIGFVFQFYHLLPDFTALENVFMPGLVRRGLVEWMGKSKDIKERAEHLLELVGLADRMKHRPAQLSGGERQRVSIARALMNNPLVLLCDEPTGNLDTKSGRKIQELLWRLNEEEGNTVVIVTHDADFASNAPRIVKMLDGRIISDKQRKHAIVSP